MHATFRRFEALCLAAIAFVASASDARAYVRTRGEGGALVRWSTTELTIGFDDRELPGTLAADEVQEAIQSAAKQWSASEISCTAIQLRAQRSDPQSPGSAVNVVFLARWCPAGAPEGAPCYDPASAAMTRLRFGSSLPDSRELAIAEA